jgi:choline dehydrogenase-like flavoprotein
MSADSGASRSYEYIVVGSGAGGGTLAARLAEAGHTVLLLEAGGDPGKLSDARLPDDYDVPAFHPFASENNAIGWDFFVRHYADDDRQRRDIKFTPERDGVLYPRAGTLGGCTAHNALIFVYPHNEDWDSIARLTGDPSWRAANMHAYFERLEECRHRPVYRGLKNLFGLNLTGHGFNGWLSAEKAIPQAALRSRNLRRVILKSAKAACKRDSHWRERLRWFFQSQADPNDWRLIKQNATGLRYAPLTTRGHMRGGSRERLLDVAGTHRDKLTIELNALATRVLFDKNKRAIGVEYLKGERLYRAGAHPSGEPGEKRQAFASREIILSGGVFNTPQLLMLSGIGPEEELRRHGIDVLVPLPGVGTNLQDRYEVSVVNRMKGDWQIMAGAKFEKGDPQYRQWKKEKDGVYITNGGILVAVRKSTPSQPLPDLFCLGLLARFEGYFPGYSKLIAGSHNYLSWVVLKAHTLNRAGTVKLRSNDPREPPMVNFSYFEEGSDKKGEDLKAVVEGVKFARTMTARLKERGWIAAEELPGENVESEEDLQKFVRENAWGHHAACTCPIGPPEGGGVLGGDFRVHGTQGLRVVDASVFPRIPGFFIVSAVYMIGEKAADVILADAERAGD